MYTLIRSSFPIVRFKKTDVLSPVCNKCTESNPQENWRASLNEADEKYEYIEVFGGET